MEYLNEQSQEVFNKEIDLLKKDLIAKYNELGLKASGKWERALSSIIQATKSNLSADIEGMNYTKQLTQGRPPGAFPPVDSIKQWIIDKPITPKDNISIDSLAFLIGRKIATVGTNLYPEGSDLIDSVITPERIKSITEKIGLNLLTTFRLDINETLKR